MRTKRLKVLAVSVLLGLLASACAAPPPAAAPAQPAAPAADQTFTVGMVIVGPMNDKGWNEAHVEGTKYVMEKMPNVKFEYVDKVNPGDRPNVKGSQVADELIAKGAKVVIFNSDDFKDDALETAKKHPNIVVIHASGDYAWKEGKNYKNQPNLGNLMSKMEPGWMIAGCASALGSENGKIGTVGPLINEETRRYASAAYLGARYCWENYKKRDPKELQFKITWIGFWFNIPGVTLDPTKVADDFYNGGFDVVMSAIDTPEVAVQGKKAAEAGKAVKYHHYDYKGGCELAPDICLGVHYYNWGPGYLDIIKRAMEGTYTGTWTWAQADWKDLNNPDTSAFGYIKGKALGAENEKFLDQFIKGLGDGSIDLWKGPLNFQDGSVFLKDGEKATDQQIWYLPQLLEGMEGPSK
ncbi:MAG: BMP family ABC transporter substrate-binding protein [Anaerolineae bacterium]|nr:BMP family ABC transporter substrate-binding protein [Anaerolineae bacterium]